MAHKDLIEHHLPDAVNRVTGAGVTMWSGSAIWSWIGTNHTQLTVCFAFIGLCFTIYGVFKRPK